MSSRRLGVLDVGDLVDLTSGLAVLGWPADPGRRLPVRVPSRALGSCSAAALLGVGVGEPGLQPAGARLQAGELGAQLEPLASVAFDVHQDRLRRRRQPREELERQLPGFLNTAEPDQQVGPFGGDVDQLALQFGGEILEIRRAGIEMETQPDQRRLRNPDVDVARGGGTLGGSHLVDYRRTMKRRRTRS